MKPYRDNKARQAVQALSQGDLLRALDLASRGLAQSPGDEQLLHTKALATLQLLDAEAARAVLDESIIDTGNKPELLCLRARMDKESGLSSASREKIQQAADLYRKASEIEPGNEFPAINAATCTLLAGSKISAEYQAEQVKRICQQKLIQNPKDFYAKISLAEAFAILGDVAQSKSIYSEVSFANPDRIRDLSSARRQARLIGQALHGDAALYESSFPRQRVLVMDHELIRPQEPRFDQMTDHQHEKLTGIIKHQLRQSASTIGFACPTSMEEFLFIELLREMEMAYHLFLPWPENDLLAQIIPDSFHARFADMLAHAQTVRVLSQPTPCTSEVDSHFSEMVMIGIATHLAQALELELEFLILNGSDTPLATISPEGQQSIKSILFADITGYSKLSDDAIPNFIEHFMQRIADLIEHSEHQPLIANTWGDALYLVFDEPEDAGSFALKLQKLISDTDWQSKGLPSDFGIRVGLHAGPVYSIVDPVIKRPSFTGFHVSWAARIEPRAAPNSIYCSEEFAALSALDGHANFRCEYVGLLPLPKDFGEKRIYQLKSLASPLVIPGKPASRVGPGFSQS